MLLAYATCTYDLAQPPTHPTLNPNIFPPLSEKPHSCCLDVRLADTHRQPRYHSPSLTNSCFISDVLSRSLPDLSFPPITLSFLRSGNAVPDTTGSFVHDHPTHPYFASWHRRSDKKFCSIILIRFAFTVRAARY